MENSVAILGSTGSVGRNALDVALHLGLPVRALAAHSSIDLLEEQIRRHSPPIVAVYDKAKALLLRKRVPSTTRVVAGMEGLCEAAATSDASIVLSAMTGSAGILPTVAAIKAGKRIALANKEVLVAAGAYIMNLAREMKIPIIPVDSEHSAIFQCLHGVHSPQTEVRRLILTASGGPFFTFTDEALKAITVEQALAHPTWTMGPKVSIDSSTLMNKGFELIEAHFLFDLPVEKIDVVVHPQSIVHSFVELIDGSILAQMSEPNMALPIQYAFTFPERRTGLMPPFDFARHSTLQFFSPDTRRFPCLALAYEALRRGGSAPCYLNAANEQLVARFLRRDIGWSAIATKLETLLLRHPATPAKSLEEILAVDALARAEAEAI
jgi:1-deoxy-D-xylulose-5-phosphate reductoisomerase